MRSWPNLEGVKPGRVRVLADGRIGKFGWKAQFATLEGSSPPRAPTSSAWEPVDGTGEPYAHQAESKVDRDLDPKQFRSLVAFVDTLPRPTEILPADPKERGHVERGETLFKQVGCVACHTPEIGGVAGIYSDFLLHRITSGSDLGGGYVEVPNVPLPDEHPLPDEWKTPPLWGVADSAPYFHDGDHRPWNWRSFGMAATRGSLPRLRDPLGRRSSGGRQLPEEPQGPCRGQAGRNASPAIIASR